MTETLRSALDVPSGPLRSQPAVREVRAPYIAHAHRPTGLATVLTTNCACGPRCVRLDIECTEQQPAKFRGRPLKLHQPRSRLLGTQSQQQASVADLPLARLQGATAPNPFRLAEIITTTFAEMQREGQVHHIKTTVVL